MTAETTTIQVPQPLYERLERLSKLTHRPVESLVVQALSASVPLLPDDLRPAQRESLLTLEDLDDRQLWEVERATFPDDLFRRFSGLRERQRTGDLTNPDREELAQLQDSSDLLMLRKAYAAVLLRWRGHSLPPLDTADSA